MLKINLTLPSRWWLKSPPLTHCVGCNARDLGDACTPSSIFGPTAIATARGLTLTHGCLVGASPLEMLAAPILLAVRPGLDPIVMSRLAIVCRGGDFTPAAAAFPVDVAAPGFFLFRPICLPITKTICAIERVDRADWAFWLWRRLRDAAETCCSAAIGLPGWTPTSLPSLPACDAINPPRPKQIKREEEQRQADSCTNATSIVPAARRIGEITTIPYVPVGLFGAVGAIPAAHVHHVSTASSAATSPTCLRILMW